MSATLLSYNSLKSKGITFSRMHIWRMERAGKFPKHVSVSTNSVAWVESEIDDWIADRIAERDAKSPPGGPRHDRRQHTQ